MLWSNLLAQTDQFGARLSTVPVDALNRVGITGTGRATAVLDGCDLSVAGTYEGLQGPANSAHLHESPVMGVCSAWAQDGAFTAEQLAAGRTSYLVNCAGCHMRDLRLQWVWSTRLDTSVQGFPVAFSVDGKQYIAVTTGLGGGSPRLVPSLIAPEIRHPATGNALYVYALPD